MQDEGEVGQAKAHAWRLARGLLRPHLAAKTGVGVEFLVENRGRSRIFRESPRKSTLTPVFQPSAGQS